MKFVDTVKRKKKLAVNKEQISKGTKDEVNHAKEDFKTFKHQLKTKKIPCSKK